MKNITRILIAFLLLSLAIIAPARAEKRTYTLGIDIADMETNWTAQLKLALNEVSTGIENRTEIKIEIVLFNSNESFLRAAKKKKLDFLFISNYDMVYKIQKQNDYKPFLGSWMVVPPNRNRFCLWVKKDGNIKTVRDARGKKLGLQSGEGFAYLQIYKLTGNRPDEFFKGIQEIPNTSSIFYALALGKVDVIGASTGNEKTMEARNPGPVKDIRELICSQTPFAPSGFFHLKIVPEADVAKLSDIMKNWRKDKIFIKYRALFEAAKVEVISVTEKDYEPLIKFYAECIKKGWDKDYQRWVKSRK